MKLNTLAKTAFGVAVGVVLAGLAYNYGRDLPVIAQSRQGFNV